MIRLLNSAWIQPLMAWRAGSPHLRHLQRLQSSQFDSPETIRQRQFETLRKLLYHCWLTVPYYRERWRTLGLHPDRFRSLEHLENYPILTKEDIRLHAHELRSEAYASERLFQKSTSGSTGTSLTISIDEPALRWKQACTLRSDLWSGYQAGGRVAKVWGNPEYRHFGWKGRLRNYFVDRATYLDTREIDDQRLDDFARQLQRKPPSLLFGHAHSLYLLAVHWRRRGWHPLLPDGIISTAMMLHDWQRRTIEDVMGTPVTNRYGCEEVSLIACECSEHQGMHVNSDSIYCEVGPDERFSQDDGAGALLVTDLVNRAMPLIRYQVGDVAVASRRVCSCGRGLPLLEKIIGREADYVLTPQGKLISGISLTENFAVRIPGVIQIQIIQEELTQLRFRMVPDESFDGESRNQIEQMVRELFGSKMQYAIELVDRIPQEASGKYRFCVSKIAQDYLKAMATS